MGLTAVPTAPSWLVQKLQPVQRKPAETAGDELDTEYAVRRAIEYLANAEPAVEGAHGDDTAYRTAARVKDFGISEAKCLELMAEFWNNECSPPWPTDELADKVSHAYHYGQNPPGSLDPRADFQPVDGEPFEPADRPALTATLIKPFEPTAIPPRRWILGSLLLRRKVSMLIAQAGMGKSTLGIGIAVAVAAGLEKPTGLKVHEPTKVWLINNEDDEEELQRRLAACLKHFEIPWSAIEGKLYIDSGERRRLTIASKNTGGLVIPQDRDALIEIIRREGIGVLIVDPLIETIKGLAENANEDMQQALSYYRDIAQQTNCADLVIHHTRKLPQASSDGHAGNLDSARGASAMGGVARIVGTLYGMSDKDAKQYGIPADRKHLYVRYDDAKANLSLASPHARWFKRVGVPLGQGDEVGVLEPLTLEQKVQPENDIILDGLISCLADEPKRRLRTVADEIAEESRAILLSDNGRPMGWGGVQKRLQKLLPVVREGWEYAIETVGSGDRQAHWVRKMWVE
jgi:hypothetical protein